MNQEEKKQTLLGYLFLVPSLAVFAVFMFYPLFYTVYLSFFEWNMVKPVKKFVGLANYAAIFRDPNSWKIAGNTAVYILVLLVLNFVLPYILSFILSAVIKRGQGFYKAVFFLPSVISLVVGSILYIWILNPISGPVALVLKYFGLALPFWSKAEGWVIAVLSIITSWKVFGYNFIIILAGVSGVSQEVIEAARMENVKNLKIMRDIIIPLVRPSIISTGIIFFINSWNEYVWPVLILKSKENYTLSLALQMYISAEGGTEFTIAMAVSVMTMVIPLALYILFQRYIINTFAMSGIKG